MTALREAVINERMDKWLRYFTQTLDHLGADKIRAPRQGELEVDGQSLGLQFSQDGVDVVIRGNRDVTISGGNWDPVETAKEVWNQIMPVKKLTRSRLESMVREEVINLLEDENETYSVYRVPADPRDFAVDVVVDEEGNMDVIQVSDFETREPVKGHSPEDEDKILQLIRSGKAEKVETQIET